MKRPKRFTLEEARSLMPRIHEITGQAAEAAAPLIRKLQDELLEENERARLSAELQEQVDAWSEEITQLGASTKGLWLVDFDSGSGYYCWRHGEEELSFFHGYDEGFSGRIPIQ